MNKNLKIGYLNLSGCGLCYTSIIAALGDNIIFLPDKKIKEIDILIVSGGSLKEKDKYLLPKVNRDTYIFGSCAIQNQSNSHHTPPFAGFVKIYPHGISGIHIYGCPPSPKAIIDAIKGSYSYKAICKSCNYTSTGHKIVNSQETKDYAFYPVSNTSCLIDYGSYCKGFLTQGYCEAKCPKNGIRCNMCEFSIDDKDIAEANTISFLNIGRE